MFVQSLIILETIPFKRTRIIVILPVIIKTIAIEWVNEGNKTGPPHIYVLLLWSQKTMGGLSLVS